MNRIKALFGEKKPVIAMAHIPALPGTPRYQAQPGLEGMVEKVRQDMHYLIEGGVDAVMFCNEDDRPYSFHATPAQVSAMTRIVTELRPKSIPFGVDFLWDPIAALSIAAATGASFMREVLTGVYESDMGLWAPDAHQVLTLRHTLNAESIAILFNIAPEFCSPLGNRSITQRARSAVTSSTPDGLLVSGLMAGAEPDLAALQEAKQAVGDDMPVFLNTGAKPSNIVQFLSVADGVIVGSSLKMDGYTWNPVDPRRVQEFMSKVRSIR